jgi:hypothetical protein
MNIPPPPQLSYIATGIKMNTSDNEEIIIESESENDDEVLIHPVFDSGTTLIGSSKERQKLIMEEQDQLFKESLDNDRRKENNRSEAKEMEETKKNHLEQLN